MKENNLNVYAICFSGGGMRAAIFTSCIIEIFQNKFNYEKIKYTSTCSGSAIPIILYNYYKLNFNKYYRPDECNLENLKIINDDTYIKKFVILNLTNDLIESLKDKSDYNIWIKIIKNIFFDDNIDNFDKNIKNPEYIINGTIFYKDIPYDYFPLEFTSKLCILPKKVFDSKGNNLYGGYSTDLNNFVTNKIISPIIKCGIGVNLFETGLEILTNGKSNLSEWNLKNPITNKIDDANLVDGGIIDILGLIGCLRRKVKNININIFTDVSILDKDFTNNLFGSGFFKYFEGNDKDNKFTFFTRDVWLKLYNELLNKYLSGKPMIVNIKTEILKNKYCEIEPYGEINFLFHLNSCNKEWFNELPKCTQNYILSEYDNFPYFKTYKLKYDPITINLIYNLIGWEILNSKEYELFYANL